MSYISNASQNKLINQAFSIPEGEIIFPSIDCQAIIEDKHGHQVLLLKGYAPYKGSICPHCQSKGLIKYGTCFRTIRLLETNGFKTALRVKVQRVLCQRCSKTAQATLSFVRKDCNISEYIRRKVMMSFSSNIAMKTLGEQVNVSASTVMRILDKDIPLPRKGKGYLPCHLSFDEFNAGNGTPAAMSFIFSDAKSHRLMDILPDRTLRYLRYYFLQFPESVRYQVKTVTMDMYSPYMTLVKDVFPNAKIILDNFHIVQHWGRAFQKIRIYLMNALNKGSLEDQKGYRRIKRYWKLLVKDRHELIQSEYRHYTLFEGLLNQAQVVERLLSYSPKLREAYNIYQEGLFAFKSRHIPTFQNLIRQHYDGYLSGFNQPLSTFHKYEDFILNTFAFPYNNGHLEALNNKIKTIKKTAYGFRNFIHLKKRCFLQMNRLSAAA